METVKCERANRIDRNVNNRGYIPAKINADSFENNFYKLFATKLGKLVRLHRSLKLKFSVNSK